MQASGKQETVQLAAGEQATIVCEGAIAFALAGGVVEIDGARLEPEKTYRLRLSRHRRATLNTLQGGAAVIKSNVHFSVQKHAYRGEKLIPLAASCTKGRGSSRVLVLGARGTGKSAAARTVVNRLLHSHAGDSDCRIVFVEGDTSAGNVCAAGTMSAVEAQPPALAVEAPFLETVPVVQYVGYLNSSAASQGHLLHSFVQTMANAEWLLRRGEHRAQHLVIDPPAPGSSEMDPTFLAQVVEVARPTHVLCLGAEASFTWVIDALKRIGGDASVVAAPPLVPDELLTRRDGVEELITDGERSFAEYLCGPPSTPLDCAAVVAPLDALTFVRAAPEQSPSAVERIDPATIEAGSVVGVSHAQTIDEVGFANIAGLLLVKSVSAKDNEVAFFAPDPESIPRGFLIVGDASMRCKPHLVTPFAI